MSARVFAAAALAAVAVAGLTGCTAIDDTLHHQTRGTYATPAALLKAWPVQAAPPSWLPADGTDVRFIAGTAGSSAATTPAAVRVTTRSALPGTCHEAERYSMDPFAEDWSPQGAYPARVERCGDWDVMPVSGGWYGWTPLAPEETSAP